jgi:putative tricarboxylic transport membrane protein
MTDANLWLFVTRPISALLLAMAAASIVLSLWQHRRMQKKSAVTGGAADF